MLETSFRKIQRVIAKAPLWRTFADVVKLMDALEKKGVNLFDGIMLNATGRFLLVSVLRDKNEEVIVETSTQIGTAVVEQHDDTLVPSCDTEHKEQDDSLSQKTVPEENLEDKIEDSDKVKETYSIDNVSETPSLPLWADLDVIVKDGSNHSINLGVYLSDWNDIVVEQNFLNVKEPIDSDDMSLSHGEDILCVEAVEQVRTFVGALVGMSPLMHTISTISEAVAGAVDAEKGSSGHDKFDAAAAATSGPIQKLRYIILPHLSAGDKLRNVFDRGALDESRDSTLLQPLLRKAKLMTLKGPRMLIAEGQKAGACFVLLSGCLVVKKRERMRGLGVDVDAEIMKADCELKPSFAGMVVGGDLLQAELEEMKKGTVTYSNTVQILEGQEAELIVFSEASVKHAVEARHDGSVGKFLSRATKVASSQSGLNLLAPESINSLTLVLRRRELVQGEVLTKQGESADTMFILCRGEVREVISKSLEPVLPPRRLSVIAFEQQQQQQQQISHLQPGVKTSLASSKSNSHSFVNPPTTKSMNSSSILTASNSSTATASSYHPSLGAHVIAERNSEKNKSSIEDHSLVVNADRVRIVQRFSLIGKEAAQKLPCRDTKSNLEGEEAGDNSDLDAIGFDLKKLKDVAMAVSFISALKMRARANLNASSSRAKTQGLDDPTLKPIYSSTATALGPCLVLEVSRRRLLQLPALVQRDLMTHLLKFPLRPVDISGNKDEVSFLSAKLELLKHKDKCDEEAMNPNSKSEEREKTVLQWSKEKAAERTPPIPRDHSLAPFGSCLSKDREHPNKPLDLPAAPGSLGLSSSLKQREVFGMKPSTSSPSSGKKNQVTSSHSTKPSSASRPTSPQAFIAETRPIRSNHSSPNNTSRPSSPPRGSHEFKPGLYPAPSIRPGNKSESVMSMNSHHLAHNAAFSSEHSNRYLLAHIALTPPPAEDNDASAQGLIRGSGILKRTKPLPSCYFRILGTCNSKISAVETVSLVMDKQHLEDVAWRQIPKTSTHLLPRPFLCPGVFDHFVLFDFNDRGRACAVMVIPYLEADERQCSLMHTAKSARFEHTAAPVFKSLGVRAGGLSDSNTYSIRLGPIFDQHRVRMNHGGGEVADLSDILGLVGPVGIYPQVKGKKRLWTGRSIDGVVPGLWKFCADERSVVNMGTSLLSLRLKGKLKKLRDSRKQEYSSFNDLIQRTSKSKGGDLFGTSGSLDDDDDDDMNSISSVEKGWAFVSKDMSNERQNVLNYHHNISAEELKERNQLLESNKLNPHAIPVNHLDNKRKTMEEAEKHIVLLDQLRNVKHPPPKETDVILLGSGGGLGVGSVGSSQVGSQAAVGLHSGMLGSVSSSNYAFAHTIGGKRSHRTRKEKVKPPLL